MSSDVDLKEYAQDGEVDVNAIVADMDSSTATLYSSTLNQLVKILPNLQKGKAELDQLGSEIENNYESHSSRLQNAQYEAQFKDLNNSLVNSGVLTDEEMAEDPNSFATFISRGMSDSEKDERRRSAILQSIEIKAGLKPLTDRQKEIYQDQGVDSQTVPIAQRLIIFAGGRGDPPTPLLKPARTSSTPPDNSE